MVLEAAGFEVESEIIRAHRTAAEVGAGKSPAKALWCVQHFSSCDRNHHTSWSHLNPQQSPISAPYTGVRRIACFTTIFIGRRLRRTAEVVSRFGCGEEPQLVDGRAVHILGRGRAAESQALGQRFVDLLQTTQESISMAGESGVQSTILLRGSKFSIGLAGSFFW